MRSTPSKIMHTNISISAPPPLWLPRLTGCVSLNWSIYRLHQNPKKKNTHWLESHWNGATFHQQSFIPLIHLNVPHMRNGMNSMQIIGAVFDQWVESHWWLPSTSDGCSVFTAASATSTSPNGSLTVHRLHFSCIIIVLIRHNRTTFTNLMRFTQNHFKSSNLFFWLISWLVNQWTRFYWIETISRGSILSAGNACPTNSHYRLPLWSMM